MSDEKNNESLLLAGHAPAVMVGGMRVGGIRPKSNSESSSSSNSSSLSNEDKMNSSSSANESSSSDNSTRLVTQSNNKSAGMVVNGVPLELKEAFPTDAVRHIHEKPRPTHETHMRAHNRRPLMPSIFQPRSFNFSQ